MKHLFGLPARQIVLGAQRRMAARPILLNDYDDDESGSDCDDCAHGPNDLSAKDAADYIETISLQLEALAQASDLTFLSYLLRLVAEEARLAADQGDL